jgi:molecular chaperone GrpE
MPETETPPPAGTPTDPPAGVDPAPVEDWETRFKYLLADFENFRKRVDRDRETQRQRAKAFERARAEVDRRPPSDPVRAGIDLLSREWQKFLASEGVSPVALTGGPFRADWHEAVDELPASPEHPPGTIVEVVQQGYTSPSGLLRPAKVVVARSPPVLSESPVAARPESEPGEP